MKNTLTGTAVISLSLIIAASCTAATTDLPIALQMYTVRNNGTLEQQFALAQRAGFHAVELVSDQGVTAHEMKRLLSKYHLQPIADHVQLDDLENHSATIVAFNKAIGNTTLVMPWIKPDVRPDSKQGWQQMGQRLDAIGKKLKAQGMTLAYHNHNFEMKKYDGQTALDILMSSSNPEHLKLELDAAWASRGGQDPAVILQRYKGRVFAIHAKDNAPIGIRDDQMNFAPAGEGLLAWNEIMPAAKAAGVQWYIVEHDKPGNEAEAIITESNKFLQQQLSPAGVK
ncbi:sugar phosphate isomerase/epimerase [Pantoea sp.]|uniref:sugar phosphate isomerase/epimerase family protein n=1 Tax=Pantoea sp. TaxID=69393 RepID=UPI0028AD7F6A|nr:sugar phosphate isomerase/epimerase [Pantoea sp.]